MPWIRSFPLSTGLRPARGLLAQDGLHARDVPAHFAELIGLHGEPRRPLHAQRKLLLPQAQQLIAELLARLAAQLLRLHHRTCRFTKEVDTESFDPASRNASRAVTSSTPSISKRTLPGCTRATQYSTLPLPLPMRTSRGF